MQGTLVTIEIIFIIKKESKTIARPIIPNLKLFSAPEIFLGSPSEFINLKLPTINIIKAVRPANIRRALRRFKKMIGAQLRVATFLPPGSLTQLSQELQDLNKSIIRAYQTEN